jgi:hypothetical protein
MVKSVYSVLVLKVMSFAASISYRLTLHKENQNDK